MTLAFDEVCRLLTRAEKAEARVAELEAYQRNAGGWMAEMIEKIDRYEDALRKIAVPVGESTLDERISAATRALNP